MTSDGPGTDGTNADRLLVAEYALGLLPAAEHRRLARRIAAEPGLAAELRLWQRRLSGLDDAYAETPPPAGALAQVEARLFGPPPAPAGLWNSLPLWRALAAGALAVAVVAIGFSLLQPPALDADALATRMVAALEAEAGSGVAFLAVYDRTTGQVRLSALAGAAVTDRDYELWMMEESGTPVSMGIIAISDMEMQLSDEMMDHLVPGTMLAVTLEPQGGSPTGDPTGPVVARGMATMI